MSVKKPHAVHIKEGTARADRGTNVEVTVEEELALSPLDVDYSKGFDRDEMFVLCRQWIANVTGQYKIDEISISLMLDQLELYSVSKHDVKTNGPMLPSSKGGVYVNPALFNMNTAHDKLLKMMREFGMTPATRGSVKASSQMDEDPMDNIIKDMTK